MHLHIVPYSILQYLKGKKWGKNLDQLRGIYTNTIKPNNIYYLSNEYILYWIVFKDQREIFYEFVNTCPKINQNYSSKNTIPPITK